jgi:peptidoglycan/xylan/chitin deacetylase (PgdA/CDA1 family)
MSPAGVTGADPARRAPFVPILLYHSVSDDAQGALQPFTVTAAQFEAHMSFLADDGYHAVSIAELVEAGGHLGRLPDRPVAITFDDGFADFAATAWPAIRRHGHKASLYMVSGHVGGDSEWLTDRLPMLGWDDLSDLAADGCEIGAHTEHHLPLDVISSDLAAVEIRRSKEVLEDGLGLQIDTFAYPFGHHNRVVRELAIGAGFRTACAVKNRLSSIGDDHYALARVTITADTDVPGLARIVEGDAVAVVTPGEAWRTTAYRWVRRAKYGHRRHVPLART